VKWAEGDVKTLHTTQIAVSVEDYETNKKNRNLQPPRSGSRKGRIWQILKTQ